jgi:putative DeoR family transcriptional regulator (stage III sporulation protein D)
LYIEPLIFRGFFYFKKWHILDFFIINFTKSSFFFLEEFMTNIEDRVVKEAYFLLQNKTTIRRVAKEFGVSKSTVHFDLSKRLKVINRALYEKINQILKQNFSEKHYRGGFSTRLKYLQNSRSA